jgi:hypothetical protein
VGLQEIVELACLPKKGKPTASSLAVLGRNLHTLGRLVLHKRRRQRRAA